MEFFNQKEDVIDIQLTQYGKRLLAQGEFSPQYYAFFDKDILYNAEFGGIREEQNDSEPRIKNETPRLKIQHNFIGVETQFNEMKKIILAGDNLSEPEKKERLQDAENKFFGINTTIGTSRLDNRYNPSWNIKFYNEHLTSAENFYTGSGQIVNVPQLEATITYRTYTTSDPANTNDEYDDSPSSDPHDMEENVIQLPDGSQVFLKDDFILLGIEEKNTNFYNENFEIEIFMEEEDLLTNTKKLVPLRFLSEEDDFLEDDELNSNFVDYYFDIEIDEEIDDTVLCKYVHEDDKKSLYVKSIFTCPDDYDFQDQEIDIYEDDDLGDAC